MNFASRFVYKNADSSEECDSFDEDELQEAMTSRGSRHKGKPKKALGIKPAVERSVEGHYVKDFSRTARSAAKIRFIESSACAEPKLAGSSWKRKYQCKRADTNVVTIRFDTLVKPSNMHTGDPEYCSACRAVLSHVSKLGAPDQEGQQDWRCEFCGHINRLQLVSDEELPKQEDTTFMLAPAPATSASGKAGIDTSLIVFCVDISGSMCVTTEVTGRVRLRGDRLDKLQHLNTDRENQYLPGQRHDVTYVSRLQSMQAAVDHQLEVMRRENPQRRVALVTFNNEVTQHGDGGSECIHLAEHHLSDWEGLVTAGGQGATHLQPITDTRSKLRDRVFELEEGGATALGPALLLSVALAGCVPGSKVIICTDGKANIGLGRLDQDTEEALTSATDFYSNVTSMAVEKGVSVSVTTIVGTDCRLEELGRVAEETGGQVNRVDPMRLTEEFGSILADRVIATNVTATFITHSGLYIRDKDTVNNKVIRHVGNVTEDTEVTFEFGIKTKGKKAPTKAAAQSDAAPSSGQSTTAPSATAPSATAPSASAPSAAGMTMSDTEGAVSDTAAQHAPSSSASKCEAEGSPSIPAELPFQMQITYIDLEGARAMRVLTQTKPVTTDRKVAENKIDMSVLGVHAVQTSAAMVKDSRYEDARLNAWSHKRLADRYIDEQPADDEAQMIYCNAFSDLSSLDQHLVKAQEEETAEMEPAHPEEQARRRRMNRTDTFAALRCKLGKASKAKISGSKKD